MQSKDYVPGVSGWKINDNGRLELNDGNQRIIAEMKLVIIAGPGQTNDQAAQAVRDAGHDERKADEPVRDSPFYVVDGKVFMRKGAIDGASTAASATAVNSLTIRVTPPEDAITSQGSAITALDNTIVGKADSATVQALVSRVTSLEAALASNSTKLAQLQVQVDIANQVRQAIRNELRPGGLLHRSS